MGENMGDELLFEGLSKHLSIIDILDNLDAGIIIFDNNGNFLFMNTVMINWRNIPRKEYMKMNVHDFNNVLDVCVFDLVCSSKKRVSRLQYYKDYQKIDSATRIRIVTGTPIFDGLSNIKYVVVLLQDVQQFEQEQRRLLEEHKVLSGMVTKSHEEKVDLIAKSPEMLQLIAVTDNIAPLDSTILLYGESGTGKEVLAKYIHEHSNRNKKPMITVNCAAFPENLIEAELFGYEKGSFTGANREGKMGLVESANSGTLFLDEINSLPLSIQGKLLRLIEDKHVRRIGSLKDISIDFRLIAATNRNLNEMVANGTFREDLYYRLNVIPLTIPPLRNRRRDIIPLCLHFLYCFCQKYNVQKSLSDNVLEDIECFPWPGNVRQLRNFVERVVVMTPSSIKNISNISKELFGDQLLKSNEKINKPLFAIKKISREQILEALDLCGNRREDTAIYLGISRRQLQYKIKEYHISARCHYSK